MIDNFLRIFFIGSRAKLPILLLFFGLLGGLSVYGPKGLFMGPLVVALVLAFLKIYRQTYRKE
jgi:predicted PurR-regulated permease PerM